MRKWLCLPIDLRHGGHVEEAVRHVRLLCTCRAFPPFLTHESVLGSNQKNTVSDHDDACGSPRNHAYLLQRPRNHAYHNSVIPTAEE